MIQGLDLSAPTFRGKCCVIDGLSTLFFSPPTTGPGKSQNGNSTAITMAQGLVGISKDIKSAIEKLSGTGAKHLMILNAEVLLSGAGVLATGLLDELMDLHSVGFLELIELPKLY